MKLVLEQSDQQLAALHVQLMADGARKDALSALIRLTANLLRLTRGTGTAHDVVILAHDYLMAEQALFRVTGDGLSSADIAFALNVFLDGPEPEPSDQDAWRAHTAKWIALSGALQLAAARLLEDPEGMVAGERELVEGLNAWERRRGATPSESPRHDTATA